MTDPTTQSRLVLAPEVSINDNLPTSSPSPKSTLIGFVCIVGVIALFTLYWNVIGF